MQDDIELVIIGVEPGSEMPEGYSIGFELSELSDKPCTKAVIENLKSIIADNRELLQKAIGTSSLLPFEVDRDEVWFDWFDRMPTKEEYKMCDIFINALYRAAEDGKGINSDKRKMLWLLDNIGLSGSEHERLREFFTKRL